MPLMHGKSKKAFGHNVEVEMEHGHPLKQSLAIAYSVKRKAAKKHAKGGMLTHKGYQPSEVPHYDADFADMDHDVEEMASGYVGHPGAHAKHDAAAEHEDMKKLNQHGKHEIGPEGRHYAKGGKVHKDMSGGQKKGPEGYPKYQEQAQNEKGIHTPVSGVTLFPHGKSTSKAGDLAKDRYAGKALFNEEAKKEHRKVLHEMKHMPKPKLKGLAHGGEVHPHQSEEHELDMVGKIMKMRQHAYAKGGYAHPRLHPEAQKKIEERNLKGRVNEVSGSPEKGINKPYRYESGHGESMVGANVRAGYKTAAKLMHKRTIKELENMPKPKLKGLAHGGAVHHYSHGGKVANNTHPFEYEFHTPNEFDDLVNRDDLEFHYTGKNSGDYLSDAREDHDRKDMVAKIMKSRAKKDKSPYGY